MVAPGFLAIGSGPAGVSAAETFRSRHRHIPVRILSSDPALPYAKPPLSKQYLCGRPADLDLHSAGWFDRNGIDLILGGFLHFQEEIEYFGEKVLPLVREIEGAQSDTAPTPAGVA